MDNDFGFDRTRRIIISVVAAIGLMGTLGACADYAKGEVLQVEEDEGESGQVKELEVVRQAVENTAEEPDSFEVHVPADSPCEVGDIYPDCDPDGAKQLRENEDD
jgi:hypothetical protein